MWFPIILAILAAAFFAFAMYTQLAKTDPTKPILKRVWAAVIAGAASLGAMGMSLFQQGGTTP